MEASVAAWEVRWLLTSFQILKCTIHPSPSLSSQYALYLSGPGDASVPQSQARAFVPPLLCFWETVFSWSFVLLVPTYSWGYNVSISTLLYTEVKVKVAQLCLILICLYTQKVKEQGTVIVAESCLTLCGPMDYTVHGILQARILGWVAFPFSRGSSWPRNQTGVSCNWAIREAWSFRLYTTPYLKDWVRGSVLPVLTPLWVLSHRILVVGCLVRTPCMRFMRVKLLSQVQLWMIPWTVACQAPLSMGYSSQEYWSGLPSTPPENLPNPGMEPTFLMSPALAGGFFTTMTTWETAWAP